MSLFSKLPLPEEPEVPLAHQPLAERMRPRTLDEFIGQEKLLGLGKPLRVQIENDDLTSMLFWGPPGCGKTTLARLIARLTRSEYMPFSAVLAGIKEIKEVMAGAERKARSGHRTIVFVDEVHRFNKAQQDAFLPHVEAGHITFIGATTENPSFEVISPLLSRTKVYVMDPLPTGLIADLLQRALNDKERGLGNQRIVAPPDVLFRMASYANGDARTAYNTLELAARSAIRGADGTLTITTLLLEDVLQRKLLRYDKGGEEHYNLISALHESVRNSDADASLYWLARMLESGKTRCTWPGVWSEWLARISGWPIPTLCQSPWRPRRRLTFSGVPRVIWRWRKQSFISRWRPSPILSIRPTVWRLRTCIKPKPTRYRCICVKLPPAS